MALSLSLLKSTFRLRIFRGSPLCPTLPSITLCSRGFSATHFVLAAASTTAKKARPKSQDTPKKAPSKAKSLTKKVVKKSKRVVAAKKEKQPVKPKSEDKPPKRSPNAWILFFSHYYKEHTGRVEGMATGREENQKLSTEAAKEWKAMTDLQKEPYYKEAKVLYEAWQKDLQRYWQEVPEDVLTNMNRYRKKRGKYRLKRPSYARAAQTPSKNPFTRFYCEHVAAEVDVLRKQPENADKPANVLHVQAMKTLAVKYRALSPEEKSALSIPSP